MSVVSACLPIGIGVVAMLGWALGVPALTQFLSTRSAMQPITALCAMLLGGSIIAAVASHGRLAAARVLAALVAALAVQTLLQFVWGIDFGTDHLLFPAAVDVQPVHYAYPGRMAAPSATAFLLIGAALLVGSMTGRLAARLSSIAATIVLLLVVVALLSQLYLVAPLGGVFGFTQVAVPTAFALGGGAIGVLALRPIGGWMDLIVGRSIGATAARWLLPVVVVIPVAVATVALRGSETGLYPRDFQLAFTTAITVALLAALERCFETAAGTRWFATTISPVAGASTDAPRFATASLEITERKRAEARQRLLLDELNHRVKNTLAVVQSLAQQSFRGDLADPAAKRAFEARLMAVAAAHRLLVQQDWEAVSLRDLIGNVAGPGCGADRARVDAHGPDVTLPPRTAVSIALALHELCTNAVKYGALSNNSGRVAVQWTQDAASLRISWTERGGPPVHPPAARGFGTRLIERALTAELGHPVVMAFRPKGLACVIETVIPARGKAPQA